MLAATQLSSSLSRQHKPAPAGVSFPGVTFQRVRTMNNEQFTAFVILLAAVSVPSVSLLFAGAWELWRYAKRAEP